MRVLVTGGGTGGHIYPALALIRKIREVEPDAEFLYVGTKNGLESKIVPKEGIPFKTIHIQGFRRSITLDNFKTIYLFLSSIHKARAIIRDFAPDVVIGTGGYVCGSVVYAASRMHIPTLIHEQNSVPGVTNKFLAKYATKIAICFPDVADYFPKNKIVLTGNPRAEEVAGIKKSDVLETYSLDKSLPSVLIFGGSRGALKINQAVIEALPELARKNYQVLYVSGERYFKEVQQEMFEKEMTSKNVSLQPYIDNMAEVLVNVQLIIGRAGATSIAEITAIGIPAILIPSPYVTNDHQTKNAQSLVKAGAVRMIPDNELTGEKLLESMDEIMTDKVIWAQMAAASKEQGIPDAATRLYHLIQEIV